MNTYQIQGSEEWKLWRRSHIGGSDAPTIMGVSPYKTMKQLWGEKVLGFEQSDNPYMQRGRELEPEARKMYEFFTDRCVPPYVMEHPHYKFLSASFDGMSAFGNFAVEIKIAGKKDHQLALKGKIPDKYYPQLQHQMFVANLDNMDYFSWNGDTHAIINVKRDEEYIIKMLEKEIEFWDLVQTKKRPTLSNEVFCSCGKPASSGIIGRDSYIVMCTECMNALH